MTPNASLTRPDSMEGMSDVLSDSIEGGSDDLSDSIGGGSDDHGVPGRTQQQTHTESDPDSMRGSRSPSAENEQTEPADYVDLV